MPQNILQLSLHKRFPVGCSEYFFSKEEIEKLSLIFEDIDNLLLSEKYRNRTQFGTSHFSLNLVGRLSKEDRFRRFVKTAQSGIHKRLLDYTQFKSNPFSKRNPK